MGRRKANLVTTEGFRTSSDEFFGMITNVEHRKHNSPFIFYLKDTVVSFDRTHELLKNTNDNDIILKAWVGQWRTDIFSFKVEDLKTYLKEHNPKILNY